MTGRPPAQPSIARPWIAEPGTAHAVALEILLNGPISRSDIATRLRLSSGSLTRLSKPLIEQGLVVEVDPPHARGRTSGRPTKPLDIVGSARHFIGLKVTAESVVGVMTDLRADVLKSAARPVHSHAPDAVTTVVTAVVAELCEPDRPISALGIGLGGLVRDEGTVVSAPFLGWSNVRFGRMVENATGISTTVDNDLVAFTAYENWFGAGRGVDRFAVVTLGAGIGYGLVIGGEMINDVDSGLGLVGHWPVDPFGPVCPAGHRGCARSMMTTLAVISSVGSAVGKTVTYDEALDLVEHNAAARRIVDDAGLGLGRLLAAIANLTAPDVIVLGGEGVRLAAVARGAVESAMATDRDPHARSIPLVLTSGDDTEWSRGAAALAIRRYVRLDGTGDGAGRKG